MTKIMTQNNSQSSSAISPAQLAFLKQERRRRIRVLTLRILLLLLFLVSWELAADLGLIDSFIFSSPSRMVSCFLSMAKDGSIFLHTGVTLWETLFSFFLTVVLSAACAVLLWSSKTLSEILEPYLVMLNSLPKSAMAPLLIVWLGNKPRTIIVAAVLVPLFGSILTLHTGFLQADSDKIRLITSLGGSRKDVLFKVLIPSSIPLIINNMKVNVGLCLVGVVIGEFLSAKAGLGFLIIYSSQVFKLDLLILSIFILCLISTVLYQVIAWVEKRL